MALRILIVEADRHAREGLRSILAAAGHEVSAASDIAGGFEMVSSGPFEVLVLDADVPLSRNAWARLLNLLRAARLVHETAGAILVASCADDLPVDLSRHGVTAVLEKPVEFHRLWQALEAMGRQPACAATHTAKKEDGPCQKAPGIPGK